MKKIILLLLLCVSMPMMAKRDVASAESLLKRIAPQYVGKIKFEQLPGGPDRFELEQKGNRVVVRGNNVNSMAMGLNHYLKYFCNSSVSWYKDDPVELPAVAPKVPSKIERKALVDNRFFLNYCTFGYTMPWWQWADWERFIDWMALQGINLPLAITGQEAVWLKVWKELGLEEKVIKEYFTGPAHLPWHRMLNMDKFQGNLPDSWLNHQASLQRQIVDRERELGMRPVLPGFSGHVPEALKSVYPDAKISPMSEWGDFNPKYRSWFLDPMDPLFPKIQKLFIKEQTKLYGTDHIYGIDPFNEVAPPSWEPEFLARAGSGIYNTLEAADPQAIWLQMTWVFWYMRKDWTPERIKAYITSIPADRQILLDYYCDFKEIYPQTENYHGQPYIWCYLGNFGGNTMLIGDLKDTDKKLEGVMKNGGKNFCGIGSTLEGLDYNTMMYEYLFDRGWDNCPSREEWINAWADRRLGVVDSVQRNTWQGIMSDIYIAPSRTRQSSVLNARPDFEGKGSKYIKTEIPYNPAKLQRYWGDLLATTNETPRDAQLFDIVNIGRQVLGNLSREQLGYFRTAYEAGNIKEMRRIGGEMKELYCDLDSLLAGHKSFLYGDWMADAAAFGKDEAERKYYMTNAQTLLTTWGERDQHLIDYANRSWNGLVKHYYGKRWNQFIDEVIASSESGKPFDISDFRKRIMDFEWEFAQTPVQGLRTEPLPRNETLALARKLYAKWIETAIDK